MKEQSSKNNWKTKLHDIIYEADTKEGKLFDIILIFAILLSIILVMLESVESFDAKYHAFLNISMKTVGNLVLLVLAPVPGS